MNRSRVFPFLAVVLLLIPFTACARKKAPLTAPAAPTVPAPATETVNSPARPLATDQVEDVLSGDLADANAHAYRTGLLGDVYFDFDESTLRADARERLAKNASFLREHPEFVVSIEGHCDERGTNDYNLSLGERRAQAAREYLASLGIGVHRMRTMSFGEERPQCTRSDESCWQLNRRAHFLLIERVRPD